MNLELLRKLLLRKLFLFLPLRQRPQQLVPDAANESTGVARPASNIKLKGRHLDPPPEHIKYYRCLIVAGIFLLQFDSHDKDRDL